MKDTSTQFIVQLTLIFFIITILIISPIIGIILSFLKNEYSYGYILIIVLIFIILVIFIIPLPLNLLFTNNNLEIQKYKLKLFKKGNWVTIYNIGNNKILKQISTPATVNSNIISILKNIPSFKYCTNTHCSIPYIIMHQVATKQMILS